jgi:bifunctional DNA-binding transcriptional regulator/antitoxin component of YhaV-PrlF toxin-antitoxin module
MKATTMTLTGKRQTVFPLDWCRREGLERGGPLNVFDLGKDGLLIRPVKSPGRQTIEKLLRQVPAGRHSRKQAMSIVASALRKVRDEDRRH